MSSRFFAVLAFGLSLCTGASAGPSFTYNRLDQVSNLFAPVSPSTNQNFETTFNSFDSFVADDAIGNAGVIDRVAVALQFLNGVPTNLDAAITGWNIFASDSLTTLADGGGLVGNIPNTGVIVSDVTSVETSRLFEISGLNIAIGGGTIWYGVRPVMNSSLFGQTFILGNGGAGNNNAVFINPLNGFSLGTRVQTSYNAALAVNVVQAVPEPASILLLGTALGLAAFASRRRRT